MKKWKDILYRIKRRLIACLKGHMQPGKQFGWFGDYATWNAAKSDCTGYEDQSILNAVKSSVLKVRNGEAVYERDSVLFDDIAYSPRLIQAFQSSIIHDELHVIDFGGSLGSSYFQHRNLFQGLTDFKWAVVEQPHFVECGKNEITIDDLNFYHTIDEALLKQNAQVLFLSSVIQYFEEPYALITSILKFHFEFIIFDRTAFVEDVRERITKQVVPDYIYSASYPAWFLNEQKFINAFSAYYELVFDFPSVFDSDGVLEDNVRVYRKGFYFKRKL